jgi:hypothetical protein
LDKGDNSFEEYRGRKKEEDLPTITAKKNKDQPFKRE